MKIHKQYENFILVNLQIELRNVALLYQVIIFFDYIWKASENAYTQKIFILSNIIKMYFSCASDYLSCGT